MYCVWRVCEFWCVSVRVQACVFVLECECECLCVIGALDRRASLSRAWVAVPEDDFPDVTFIRNWQRI